MEANTAIEEFERLSVGHHTINSETVQLLPTDV